MNPIQQELKQALESQVSPQFLDQLVDACGALSEHYYNDYELPLLNALNREQEALMIEEAHGIINDALVQVCLMHRVSVDNTTTNTESLSKLIRALLHMQYWEDAQSILVLCESDASDEDKLASIVALVGELSELEAGDMIAEVDPNFLRGLVRLHTKDGISIEEEQFEIPKEQLEKLRSWRDTMDAQKALGFRMVSAGYKPGYAFSEYIKRVAGSINQKGNDAIAFEVIPFLLLGRDTWMNPLKGWRDNNTLLGLDLNDITGIDAIVLRLLGEYDRLSKKA